MIPFIGSLFLIYPLLRLAISAGVYAFIGTALFLIGMVLMFGSSTLYHAVTEPKCKARLRILDHSAIYVMIAGSYSPICLYVVGGWVGWTLFIFLWVCVLAGTIGKFIAIGKYPHLSLILYLAMGWVALLIMRPMWLNMPHSAFWWILAEGVFYTVGAYFFHGDEKHAYWHAIWHVFITLGAMSHTIGIWLILV
ncbi:MAG: hemolysin III family protein [Paludibacteraceae bacterium]|nr:hemolysin III family protein [Paludibacteraceae bacterium]